MKIQSYYFDLTIKTIFKIELLLCQVIHLSCYSSYNRLVFFAQCSYKKFHARHVIKIFFPHRIFSWTSQSYLFIVLDIRGIRRRPRSRPHNACKSYVPDFDFSRRSIDSRMNRLSLPVNYVVARP